MKTQLLIAIVFLTVQFTFGQNSKNIDSDNDRFVKDTIGGIYIPKNLEDCIIQIDSFWDDSTKILIKSWTEDEFSTNAHFGFGMWMRNNWQLWGGSRLSKYFNDMGVYQPDDISGIILDSYYRYLTGKDINLDEQIGYYKAYWEVNKEPSTENYPEGNKNIELNKKMGYNFKKNNYPGCIHVQTNSTGDKLWIYDYHFGWLQITGQELTELNAPEQREETIKKLFGKE